MCHPAAGDLVPPDVPRQPVSVTKLSAEERAELLRPRILGMTGGSTPAPRVRQSQLGADKLSRLPRGLHPKIDAWISALDARDRDSRQVAALALKQDPKALKAALDALDPQAQARIRRDWEAQIAKTRAGEEVGQQKSTVQTLFFNQEHKGDTIGMDA